MLTNFLAAGNAAHLIAILTGLGWRRPRPWAWPRSGRASSSGRLVDVALGGRLHPLTMTLIVCLLLPLSSRWRWPRTVMWPCWRSTRWPTAPATVC